jgi:phage-related protein
MIRDSRPISWIKAARKDYERFPEGAQLEIERALTVVAEGRYPDIAKPLKGFGSGVFELALRFRSDAFRVVYAIHVDDEISILHAFQKKSKTGIKTPQHEIDLVRERLKRLKEMLR